MSSAPLLSPERSSLTAATVIFRWDLSQPVLERRKVFCCLNNAHFRECSQIGRKTLLDSALKFMHNYACEGQINHRSHSSQMICSCRASEVHSCVPSVPSTNVLRFCVVTAKRAGKNSNFGRFSTACVEQCWDCSGQSPCTPRSDPSAHLSSFFVSLTQANRSICYECRAVHEAASS